MFTCLIHLYNKNKIIHLTSVHVNDILLVGTHYN